jgi:hypothetical protein
VATESSLQTVRCKNIAALIGSSLPASDLQQAALDHDRVVGAALEVCTSVIPFRLGIVLPSAIALRNVLVCNQYALNAMLRRLHDRVEMGVRVRLQATSVARPCQSRPLMPAGLQLGLKRIRALAPNPSEQRETLVRRKTGFDFAGCYLIARQSIESFWAAADELARQSPKLPIVGSGPWAAYSFATLPLRTEAVTPNER